MKKNYMAPQTEAIEVFASQVLMASPGYIPKYDLQNATGNGGSMR